MLFVRWRNTSAQKGQVRNIINRFFPMMKSGSHICISKLMKGSSAMFVICKDNTSLVVCQNHTFWAAVLFGLVLHLLNLRTRLRYSIFNKCKTIKIIDLSTLKIWKWGSVSGNNIFNPLDNICNRSGDNEAKASILYYISWRHRILSNGITASNWKLCCHWLKS